MPDSRTATWDEVLPSHEVRRLTISSRFAGHDYEVLLAGMPPAAAVDVPVPLLVVLDGYMLGMSAIETARLLGMAGEIEPIRIATVSPTGSFAANRARRLLDFTDTVENTSDPVATRLATNLEAAGLTLAAATGGSSAFRRFLAEELLPSVLAATEVDQGRLALYGHSAAGSFALETLLEGDTPFRDYVIGEPGTFMLFGSGPARMDAAKTRNIPARRLVFADSSDTMESRHAPLFECEALLHRISDELGVAVESRRYDGDSHTTMIPAFLKDSLLALYGTGKTYADSFSV